MKLTTNKIFLCSVSTALETEPDLLKSMTSFENPGCESYSAGNSTISYFFGALFQTTSIKIQIHQERQGPNFLR